MRINSLLQPNLTGKLIKFLFFKTTMTFRSLNPVLTLLACVNNNDMGGIVPLCPLDTMSQMKMCFGIFTRDNPSKHNRGKRTCMHENQPANTTTNNKQQVPLSKARQQNGVLLT